MRIERPSGPDDPRWLALRSALWPASADEHRADMTRVLERGDCVLLAVTESGDTLGFVEATQRRDYVNGTTTSPVAFLEGIYVTPDARRTGVARQLFARVVTWAAAAQITEIASDAPLSNTASHALHRALGFAETERVVYFRRKVIAP